MAGTRQKTLPVRKNRTEGERSYSYRYYGYHGYRREKRPREVNKRLLIATLLFLLIAIPSVFFWHQHQLQKLCVSLLTYAERMESEEKWLDASNAYHRYIKIKPSPEVQAKLSLAYDKGSGPRDRADVIASYQRSVGVMPDRFDLRLRLCELLTIDGQCSSAIEQANLLLEKEPEQPDARKWYALATLGEYRQGLRVDVEAVLSQLRRAFEIKPRDLHLATEITQVIRQDMQVVTGMELAAEADSVMDHIVAVAPQDPYAYLARAQYRNRYSLPGASADIDRAMTLAPDQPNVLRIAAWDALKDKAWLSARGLFKRIIELEPDRIDGYLGLGDVDFFVNQPSAAIDIWTTGRKKATTTLPLLLRLAEAQIQLGRLHAAEVTLHEIEEFTSSMASRGVGRDFDWVTGQVSMLRGNWHKAKGESTSAIKCWKTASLLGHSKSLSTDGKSIKFLALLRLGDAYFELEQWEQAASQYDQALDTDANVTQALLGSAEAWSNLGQPDRAIQYAQRAVQQNNGQDALFYQSKYLLQKQLQTPKALRKLADFEASLAIARRRLPNSWELRLLEADYLLHSDGAQQTSKALGVLWSLEQGYPQDQELWRRLPWAYQLLGHQEESDRAIGHLEELTTSSVTTKILLFDLLLWRKQIADAEVVLDGIDYDSVNLEDQRALDFARLRLTETQSDPTKTDSLLMELADKYPDEVGTIERALDRRLLQGEIDQPAFAALVERLQSAQAETSSGSEYYSARLEMQKRSSAVNEQISLLRNRRPHWEKTKLLVAIHAIAMGSQRDAKSALESAATSGATSPAVYRLLTQQYVHDNQYLTLWQMLDRWSQTPMLSGLHLAHRAIQRDRVDLQQELDQQPDNPASAIDALWELILRERLQQPVSERLAKHLRSFKDDPSLLMLQLRNQVAAHNDDGAQKTIEHIRALEGVEVAYLLGQALETSQQLDAAQEAYASVQEDSPGFAQANSRRREIGERLRHLADVPKTDMPSKSLEQANLRLEAVVKLRRAGKNDLVRARKLLESLTNYPSPDSNDRLLLATCYEGLGENDAADSQLRELVAADPSAHHLAVYADFLLRQTNSKAAEAIIDQLEQQAEPNSKSIQLRARWLLAVGRMQDAHDLVEQFAVQQVARQAETDLPEHLRRVAAIYEELGMRKDAERWLRFLADRFPDQSEPLTMLLIADEATEHAVQLCIEKLESEPSSVTATLLARIMLYGSVSEELHQRSNAVLEQCLHEFSNDTKFLFAMGNLRLSQGNHAESIRILKQVTEINQGHFLAWNNLAALLAEDETRQQEAMECVDKALRAAVYEVPTLNDTKAVVLMRLGQYELAAEILKQVTSSQLADDPRYFFHHALVLDYLEEGDRAKEALANAFDLGLEKAFLTDKERKELLRLQEKYTL